MKLLLAMMLVVSAMTALALYFAQRSLAANVQRELEREFDAELAALHNAQQVRHAALVERCRTLVRKSRIHAALEDNALDLLYPSAEDELRDITARAADSGDAEPGKPFLRAEFYRFLDRNGAVIAALTPNLRTAGPLSPREEAALALPRLPEQPQTGYLARDQGSAAGGKLTEIIAMPIASGETGEAIAALVLGFKPFELGAGGMSEMKSGLWLEGRLHSARFDAATREAVTKLMLAGAPNASDEAASRIEIEGEPHLLFAKPLNPDSLFPKAWEICVFPLQGLVARQRALGWQFAGAGALLFLIGLTASHFAAARLSAPVEKLAVDSERSARFSADASHQLKTPVTVLRAGLEELLTRDNLTPEECNQLSALIHQTYRLSSLIDDLLLLSRMDAGRLKLNLAPVNLTQLIEASLDDLGALPDDLGVNVETEFPPDLHIFGEKRYTAIILQNLLENARKYNRAGGRIRVAARVVEESVLLAIANTGQPIAAAAQAHIFERFHRGAIGENVPGYGLGLNLARELARLHQGDLRLVRSDAVETEFEVRFKLAQNGASALAALR